MAAQIISALRVTGIVLLLVIALPASAVIAPQVESRYRVDNSLNRLDQPAAVAGGINYFAAVTLSPDGRFLAYSLNDGRPANFESTTLVVKDLASGALQILPGRVRFLPTPFFFEDHRARPVWSPDGRRLAYVSSEEAHGKLRLWDRTTGVTETIDEVAACDMDGAITRTCRKNPLQWAPDGKTLYFLGVKRKDFRGQELSRAPVLVATAGTSSSDADDVSVTVRTTSAKTRDLKTLSAPWADVFAYSTTDVRLTPLTSGGRFEHIQLSPSGEEILAIAPGKRERTSAKQDYQDYFIVETKLSARREVSTKPILEKEVRDARGKRIIPIASSVRQRWPSVAWSPDGRQLAFVEQGALTDGDILLIDVMSGRVTSATAQVSFGLVSDVDADDQSRDYEYPGSKFGSSAQSPIWVAGGRELLVLRRARASDGWRTSLWRLVLSSGRAEAIRDHTGCDVANVAPDGNSAVSIVITEFCDGRTIRFAVMDLTTGSVVEFANTESARSNIINTKSRDHVVFVRETSDQPPEAFAILEATGRLVQLTEINSSVRTDDVSVRDVRWTDDRGQTLSGTLYLPGGRDPASLPLIVEIYPTDTYRVQARHSTNRFPNPNKNLLAPLPKLLRDGVAVLRPNIPVGGGGRACDALAKNMERALVAVAAEDLADTSRAGVIGHSFGGWAVNCIVTRTNVFKAAISVAGASDLISLHFAPVGRQWARGGGQVSIAATLSEAPMLYWRESPISALAEVNTPLLLIHGRLDPTVPVTQSQEMFEGLSDMDKPVELVLYERADHGSMLAWPDYQARVQRWFGQYLMFEAVASP